MPMFQDVSFAQLMKNTREYLVIKAEKLTLRAVKGFRWRAMFRYIKPDISTESKSIDNSKEEKSGQTSHPLPSNTIDKRQEVGEVAVVTTEQSESKNHIGSDTAQEATQGTETEMESKNQTDSEDSEKEKTTAKSELDDVTKSKVTGNGGTVSAGEGVGEVTSPLKGDDTQTSLDTGDTNGNQDPLTSSRGTSGEHGGERFSTPSPTPSLHTHDSEKGDDHDGGEGNDVVPTTPVPTDESNNNVKSNMNVRIRLRND